MIASPKEIDGAEVAAHYDALDHFYRDVWGEHVHHGWWLRGDETRAEALRALVEMVADRAGDASVRHRERLTRVAAC